MKPSERIEEIYCKLIRRGDGYTRAEALIQYLDEQYELQQAEKLAEASKWICPMHGPAWCTCKRQEVLPSWVPKLTPEQVEELRKGFEPFKKEIEEKK